MNKDSSIFIVAGAIVIVPAGVPKPNADDLMNSLLLAQLVANKHLQRAPTVSWYDSFMGVLGDFWVSLSKTRQDWQPEKESVGAPLDWIDKLPLGDQRADIIAVLSRVARLPGSMPAMATLRRHAQLPYGPAPASPVHLLVIMMQGPVSMSGFFMQFNTGQVVDPNPWGQRFYDRDINGSVSACYFQAHLSEILFAPARGAIALKIEAVVGDNVADITAAINALEAPPTEETRV
jgi:hypothetical protein